MTCVETRTDAQLAADFAEAAGRLLLEIRVRAGADIGKVGDREANRFLLERLVVERPGDAVLSEESVDGPERLSADRVWIIDPLDGTREFGTVGRTDWAVHVALWERGELVAGAVALPALGVVYGTGSVGPGPAATISAADRTGLRIVASASRPPEFLVAVAKSLNADIVPMGSAGAKTMAVVRGEADAYVHGGGQWEWDSAAPVAVARAAGLHASRIDGSELRYNQENPYLPDLLICRRELADGILTRIKEFMNDAE